MHKHQKLIQNKCAMSVRYSPKLCHIWKKFKKPCPHILFRVTNYISICISTIFPSTDYYNQNPCPVQGVEGLEGLTHNLRHSRPPSNGVETQKQNKTKTQKSNLTWVLSPIHSPQHLKGTYLLDYKIREGKNKTFSSLQPQTTASIRSSFMLSHLLRCYYMPDTVLGATEIRKNKKDSVRPTATVTAGRALALLAPDSSLLPGSISEHSSEPHEE